MVKTETTIWCVAANVRPEPFGRASAMGTKHFVAGALVWILSGYFRESMDRVRMLGRHRVSARWIAIVDSPHKLTNFRAKSVHHPILREKLMGLLPDGRWSDREHCEDKAALLNGTFEPTADLRGEIVKWRTALGLMERDEQGRALAKQATFALATWETRRQVDRTPPFEVQVLAEWLDKVGAPLSVPELVRTFDRRRRL